MTRVFPVGVQLQDLASLTQDVKDQAKTMLGKAQKKKENFEDSNKKLKDFIQKIRDFLMGTAANAGLYWVAGVTTVIITFSIL